MMNASMPRPETRRAAILELLRSGERLTQMETLRRGLGWRLAADIEALKHDYGWNIHTDMIDQGKGRKQIARYRLMSGGNHE